MAFSDGPYPSTVKDRWPCLATLTTTVIELIGDYNRASIFVQSLFSVKLCSRTRNWRRFKSCCHSTVEISQSTQIQRLVVFGGAFPGTSKLIFLKFMTFYLARSSSWSWNFRLGPPLLPPHGCCCGAGWWRHPFHGIRPVLMEASRVWMRQKRDEPKLNWHRVKPGMLEVKAAGPGSPEDDWRCIRPMHRLCHAEHDGFFPSSPRTSVHRAEPGEWKFNQRREVIQWCLHTAWNTLSNAVGHFCLDNFCVPGKIKMNKNGFLILFLFIYLFAYFVLNNFLDYILCQVHKTKGELLKNKQWISHYFQKNKKHSCFWRIDFTISM